MPGKSREKMNEVEFIYEYTNAKIVRKKFVSYNYDPDKGTIRYWASILM